MEDKKTLEEKEEEVSEGKRAEDIYTEEGREELLNEGVINPEDEGFVEGYEKASDEDVECDNCKKILQGPSSTYERVVSNIKRSFCSVKCADEFEKKEKI